MSTTTTQPTEKLQSLSTDYNDNVMSSLNDFCSQQSLEEEAIKEDLFNFCSSSAAASSSSLIVQHLSDKYNWDQSAIDVFYSKACQAMGIDKSITLSQTEKELFKYQKNSYNSKSRSQLHSLTTQHPNKPQTSIQVKRISHILTQYQSWNNKNNYQLDGTSMIHHLISNGNIECDDNIGEYKYNDNLLLNDWYYILMHYCDDTKLFERLYQYITEQMGTICDIKDCEFIKRNFYYHINDNDDIDNNNQLYYYAFGETEQRSRIRFLDTIHGHLCHSYDIGFKLTTNEKNSVDEDEDEKTSDDDDNDGNIDEKDDKIHAVDNLLDYKTIRLRTIINEKVRNLKKIIGSISHENNKFVTGVSDAANFSGYLQKCVSNNLVTTMNNDNQKTGQIFYYWDYWHSVDWYVAPKYTNLKEEIITNNLLDIDLWNLYCNEAVLILSTFLGKSYTAVIERFYGTYFYGLKADDELTVSHLLSVLLFCNHYNLQKQLKKTYTKLNDNETDDELRLRHSSFANWSRLLRETVEIYKNVEFQKKVNSFYHGTSVQSYFNEIYQSLYSPTSMTRSREVAMCYSHRDGLLLELTYVDSSNDYNSPHRYFECNWLSSIGNQNEILFVTTTSPLKFKAIINISLSHNYSHYISAMSLIEDMLHGDPIDHTITKQILKAFKELINFELNNDKFTKINKLKQIGFGKHQTKRDQVADYVFEFFDHFIKNINYPIQFDLYKMNNDYKQIKNYFLTKKKHFIKLDAICKLFPSIKYISITPGWALAKNYALTLTRNNMLHLYNIFKSMTNTDNINDQNGNDDIHDLRKWLKSLDIFHGDLEKVLIDHGIKDPMIDFKTLTENEFDKIKTKAIVYRAKDLKDQKAKIRWEKKLKKLEKFWRLQSGIKLTSIMQNQLKDNNNKIYDKIDSKLQRLTIENPKTKGITLKEIYQDFHIRFSKIGWKITCDGTKFKQVNDVSSTKRLILVKI